MPLAEDEVERSSFELFSKELTRITNDLLLRSRFFHWILFSRKERLKILRWKETEWRSQMKREKREWKVGWYGGRWRDRHRARRLVFYISSADLIYLRSGTLWTLQPGHDVARYQILRILERLDQPDIFLFLTFHLVAPFGCSFPFLHALLVATLFATRFSRLFHYPLLFLLCVFLSFFILRHILRFFLLRRLLVLLILSFAPFPHCVPSLCVSFAF